MGSYAHPWFDPSSTYLPPTYKELFRWCQYLYTSNSAIAPIINKKCSYVITGLVYETKNQRPKELWTDLLEGTLRLPEMEFKYLLDFAVYGNAFASLNFPFERYFLCPCGNQQVAQRGKWVYDKFKFIATCKKCKRTGPMEAKDREIRNRTRIKLIRWNPQYIDIRYNPLTDESEYIFRIPKALRQRIENRKINRVFVEGTRMEFLEAIRDKKNLLLDESNIYHFKAPSVSAEDDAFGMPSMMAIFKDAWLYQTYKRAQEAIALEHILPLTLLIPQPAGNGISPHMSTDLSVWSSKMMDVVHRWRRDQNAIYTVPFPVTVENVRGDAKALGVQEEMAQLRQGIAGGLDVPIEFVIGGLNWAGSSISLRVLENLFLSTISQLNRFIRDFVVPKLQRFLSLPPVTVRHRDFKMADDAQQKTMAMGMRQTNDVSQQTILEELGFDPEREKRRKAEEARERDIELTHQMNVQAEAQGKALLIQTRYQMKAQQEISNDVTAGTQQVLSANPGLMMKAGAAARPLGLPELKLNPNPLLLDLMVDRFLRGPGDAMTKRLEFQRLEGTDKHLAGAIKERLRLIRRQGSDKTLKPLPEQRAPRRAVSPV